ncbi:MAG: hypothetical protein ACT6FC_07130, partial [Methanosarcinaceae archaeon]
MKNNSLVFGLVITAILMACMPVVSASSYTLGVFGNSNEDDTIDMEDVKYTASVVLGLGNQTQLADAKYDNGINILDVTQIELIILGLEKELTVLDADNKIVTVPQPINGLVVYHHQCAEMLQILDVDEKVVGVRDTFNAQFRRFPLISAKPSIGNGGSP